MNRPAANPPEPGLDSGDVVRPFIVTGGRTRPDRPHLRIETLVSALPGALAAPLGHESRAIVELCLHPRSVAEIAALLPVPLGVARVLVSDLSADGYVYVHDQRYGWPPGATYGRQETYGRQDERSGGPYEHGEPHGRGEDRPYGLPPSPFDAPSPYDSPLDSPNGGQPGGPYGGRPDGPYDSPYDHDDRPTVALLERIRDSLLRL
ncbi:DUF742 domain-containing protein [Streptomyces sp. B1866]|uniref:DUF742 domain-containing protein n=1 Tax=Streptomyces sp. B1866 TaxID=3075431 RepID=UPI00288FFF6A|nr:DUF742 domain-containing protein [Streptomyces sp. B1866]MDT3395072.1 DUF742 domain-containing protein [Streptomyces sp. B1866]